MYSTAMSLSSASAAAVASGAAASSPNAIRPSAGIRFCGLRREALGLRSVRSSPQVVAARRSVAAAATAGNGAAGSGGFDYDLVIIGAGVGGHGAALHAVEKVSYAHAALQVLLGGV